MFRSREFMISVAELTMFFAAVKIFSAAFSASSAFSCLYLKSGDDRSLLSKYLRLEASLIHARALSSLEGGMHRLPVVSLALH